MKRPLAALVVSITCAAAGLALASPASAAAQAPKKPHPHFTSSLAHNAQGNAAHLDLTKKESDDNRAAAAAGDIPAALTNQDLQYFGGSVMRDPVNYAIFWQPSGTTAFPASYKATLQRYFEDIGGTPYYNILTQFGDNSGTPVPDSASFGGAWTDTNSFPHAGTVADPLTDGDIQTAVSDAVSANPAWQAPGLGTEYFVYLPSGVAQCVSGTECFDLPGEGANGKYCAYHSHFGSDIYATMPYDGSAAGCPAGANAPNGSDADVEASVTSHEMFESNTDPNGDGWHGPGGGDDENGDKCNFNLGSTQYPNGVDIVLHGDPFQLQLEWSNNNVRGCVKRYGPDPQISLSGTLDFGTVPRGTSATQTVTVSNGGGGDANLLYIGLGAGSDPAYSLIGVPPTTATLGAGQSRAITVKYTAPANSTTPGAANGSLVVDTDNPTPGDGTYTVTADGVVGVPHLVLSPAQITFGTVCGGGTQNQTFTVSNAGTAPATVSSVAMGPGSSPALSVLPVPPLPLTLQPGDTATFTVQLSGSGASAGPVTGDVVITSDDPASPQTLAVSGTIGAPQLKLGTSALGFGGVPVDDRTAPHTGTLGLIVSNVGDCPLTVSSLTLSGPDAADFTVVAPPALPVVIPPGSDLTFSVRVDPSAVGDRSATLTIDSDDPLNGAAAVQLSSTGLLPAISASLPALVFPPTVVSTQVPGYGGTSLSEVFTDTGQAELIVDSLTASGAPFSVPGAATPPNRYAPSDGFAAPVTFTPTAVGKFTGQVTASDADPEGPVSLTVPTCGEGVQRGIRVLVVNGAGVPYQTVDSLTLQSHGTSVHVNDHQSALPLVPVPTSCVAGERRQYENQTLPATDTLNQRGSYFVLSVSAGGKSTSLTFTLGTAEFKTLVVTVK